MERVFLIYQLNLIASSNVYYSKMYNSTQYVWSRISSLVTDAN